MSGITPPQPSPEEGGGYGEVAAVIALLSIDMTSIPILSLAIYHKSVNLPASISVFYCKPANTSATMGSQLYFMQYSIPSELGGGE